MAGRTRSPSPPGEYGSDIRAARLARGWTLEILAERAETTGSYVSRIEHRSVVPSVEILFRIAQALDLRDVVRALSPYAARRAS